MGQDLSMVEESSMNESRVKEIYERRVSADLLEQVKYEHKCPEYQIYWCLLPFDECLRNQGLQMHLLQMEAIQL